MKITEEKICLYLKEVGTSWLNKFEEDMTFGQLIDIISDPKTQTTFEVYSPMFNKIITQKGFKISEEIIITGVLLESGKMVRLTPEIKYNNHAFSIEFQGYVPDEWRQQFEDIKKQNANSNRINRS